MATIVIDDPDAVEATGNPVPGLPSAAVVNESRSTPDPEPTPQAEEEIPEKFRGKQLKDILKSYEDMEKLVGRQGSELGELRRTHDEVIRSVLTNRGQSQTAKPQNEAAATDDDAEFFLNPQKAIEKAVERHPLVQGLRQQQAQTVQERALTELGSKHSDWKEVVQSPEFAAFVQSDPVYGQLMVQADRNYNVAAADHVLKQFKAQRPASATPAAQPAPGVEDMRKAAVAASKVPAGASAPAAGKGKKVYSRAEVIRKMHSDPEWYQANADDILQAYSEGRMR